MFRIVLAVLALLPMTAFALPSQTLYVRASHLGEETLIFYTAFQKPPTDEDPMGSGVMPMAEEVATVLSSLELDKLYACDAHVWVNANKAYIYQLSGCH